jgi:anti-anti-sigma factor
MPIETRTLAEVLLVRPAGRIDHASSAAFEAALAPLVAAIGPTGRLVLDFSRIDYISSVGLRVLMVASRQLRERQRPLVVAALQPVVAEIFAISRFDKVLTLAPSVAAALDGASDEARSAWAASAGGQPDGGSGAA